MVCPQPDADRCRSLGQLLERLGLSPPPEGSIDLRPLHEALTHTSAGLAWNHERLEFLGDAVLRLACAEFLEERLPHLSMGQRSALRAQLVSDRWLADHAASLDLDALILQGPQASGDLAGRRTVRAECCEALVGGLYEAWGSALLPVRRWLDAPWWSDSAALLADPSLHNWKSALQEWSQRQDGQLPTYRTEERERTHGSQRRFHSAVAVAGKALGEGWGPSRRMAEQEAARSALQRLSPEPR
jgi:ribonuclease III